MRIIIDRIEESIAVCELPSGKMIDISLDAFEGAREGDVFDITFNPDETEKRKNFAKSRLNALFNKNNK